MRAHKNAPQMHGRVSAGISLGLAVLVSCTLLADGDRRLVEAAKRRDTPAVRALLAQSVDVNGPQSDGATALHWAIHWDDLDTADLLIRAGANVQPANDYGVTPLILACANGNPAAVMRLLDAGA